MPLCSVNNQLYNLDYILGWPVFIFHIELQNFNVTWSLFLCGSYFAALNQHLAVSQRRLNMPDSLNSGNLFTNLVKVHLVRLG